MKRKLTLLSLSLTVLIAMSGINCTSLPLLSRGKSFELSPQNLTIPDIPVYRARSFESKPAAISANSPGYRISIQAKTTSFYKNSTGVIKLWLENSGDTPVFIYKYGVRPDWLNSDWYSADSGITINPGEKKYTGMISFKIEKQGSTSIKPGVSILAKAKDGKWYDYGNVLMDPISYKVSEPLPNESQYEYKYNALPLFQKINGYITPEEPSVKAMAREIAQKYPGKYNVYQICSVFDIVSNNIAYTSEPEGEDYWQYPNETIRIKSGDCEDHAFLLASLIQALDGTTRIYATDDHMFASIYIGDANHTSKVAEAINRYYSTPLTLHYQTDRYGSWLILEPSGGFYAGSLPVGGRPTMSGGWTFNNTTTLYAFDVMPK